MSLGRRSARRQALFILYQQDLLGLPVDVALCRVEDQVSEYAEVLVRGVDLHRLEIDSLLSRHLEAWELSRLGVMERAILRLATFELLHSADVPPAVVIDQAVEHAKRYCSNEAGALVNGVLGALLPLQHGGGGGPTRTSDKAEAAD